jgi:hypothetical protein
MAPPVLAKWQRSIKIEPLLVIRGADHSSLEPSIVGAEQVGPIRGKILKFTVGGQEVRWTIDPDSGHLLRSVVKEPDHTESVTEYSDWRNVDGLFIPFSRRWYTSNGQTSETIINQYWVNPTIDSSLFQKPSAPLSFTLKVLQAEQVPYTVESGGGVSTNCQINGSTPGLSKLRIAKSRVKKAEPLLS